MKAFLILPFIFVLAAGQFGFGGSGGFGGLGGLGGLGELVPKIQIPNVGLPDLNIPLLNDVQNFGDFLAQTGKTYADATEKTLREGIFAVKKGIVDINNAAFDLGKSTFKLGINVFSDLSSAEFVSKLTGYERDPEGESKSQKYRVKAPSVTSTDIPDSFDWRQEGGVTPVTFQSSECQSCWSFAVTGAMEGHNFRKTSRLTKMSEQNLIDCSQKFGNNGCNGGYQEYGFSYVIDNNGIAGGENYPYEMKDGECHYKKEFKVADIKSYAVIEPGNEEKMKEVIAKLGPLACSVNVYPDSFQLYKEGIYNDDECNKKEVNHSVLVVGYGTEKGQDYWIVKNSWSDKWGEAGYIRIPRNKNGFCGIASECSYPLL